MSQIEKQTQNTSVQFLLGETLCVSTAIKYVVGEISILFLRKFENMSQIVKHIVP